MGKAFAVKISKCGTDYFKGKSLKLKEGSVCDRLR